MMSQLVDDGPASATIHADLLIRYLNAKLVPGRTQLPCPSSWEPSARRASKQEVI
jgi:hypothetical protein